MYPIVDRLAVHPTTTEQRYPQPGDPNPVVGLSVIRVEAAQGARTHHDHVWAGGSAEYVPRFGWTPVESHGDPKIGETEPQRYIGVSRRLMLFFATEFEPGVAPIDPRANLFTVAPFGEPTEVRLAPHVVTRWEEFG